MQIIIYNLTMHHYNHDLSYIYKNSFKPAALSTKYKRWLTIWYQIKFYSNLIIPSWYNPNYLVFYSLYNVTVRVKSYDQFQKNTIFYFI